MNICMLSFDTILNKQGGVETYVHQLSKHFVTKGHQVFVIFKSSKSHKQKKVVNGVNYIGIPLKTYLPFFQLYSLQMLLFNFQALLEVTKIHRNEQLDIVHAQFCSGFLYGLLSRLFSTKFVVTLHGTKIDEQHSRKGKSASSYFLIVLERLSIKFADGIIASSFDTLQNAQRYYKIEATKTTVIYSGAELEQFKLIGTKKKSDQFNVLYVGRTSITKRIHLLMQAAFKLVKKHQNIRFILVGPDPCAYSQNQIFKDFRDSFVFTGTVSEERLVELYQQSNVFVLPSKYEGFGLVVIEAFASGTPVIAYSVGSLPELIENGKNGILLDASSSVSELARSIEKLMDNKILCEKMGNYAKVTAEKFTWKKSGDSTLKFYCSV